MNRRWLRCALTMGVVAAVCTGAAAQPASADVAPVSVLAADPVPPPGAPLPPHPDRSTDPVPGAPDAKPPKPAAVFVPSTTIDRTPEPNAPSTPWDTGTTKDPTAQQRTQSTAPSTSSPSARQATPQAAPLAQAAGSGPSKVPKAGLGTQKFYPLERRGLGDRMELLTNLSNGNIVVRDKDLAFAGTGLNTAVNHDYNNLAEDRGAFGQRWTMSTGSDIGLLTSDPNVVKMQGPSGYWQNYTSNGSGGYNSPSGADAKLAKTSSGWTLTFDKTKEKWNFDRNGYFVSQVDANNNTITYQYNPDNTLASITDTRGAVTNFEYDSAGRVVRMKDPTGFVYGDYTYDALGQHTGFTDPSGKRVAYGYDTLGNLTSITDPNGNITKLSYDSQHRVTRIEEPREGGAAPAVTTYAYPSATQTTETAPTGGTTTYTFDNQGRQTKAKDPVGREQGKTYTANSDAATTTSIGGNVTTSSYDTNNNLIGTQLPTGAKNTVGYTDAANPTGPTSVTDPEGRQTTMTYDGKGNPLTVKQAQTGQGITRTYNPNGTVKDSTDGRGNKTSYAYDGDGRLITVTPPAPRKPIRYTYDARSRITSVTDGNGVTLKYAYDAADRVTQLSKTTTNGDRVVQQTDFDANGNKTANYFDGFTTQFTYSPRNQVLSGVRRNGILVGTDTTTYTYDANDNIASLKDAGGTTSYRYNQANDATDMTDIAGGITRFTYDGDGNRSNTAYPNGAGEAREYDKSKRNTKTTSTAKGSAPSIRTYSYAGTKGDTSLVQTMGEPNNSTTRYSYDSGARLLRALNTNNANNATITDYGYGYDASSNLTGFQGKAQTFNAANELTGIAGTPAGADNQGNFTSASGTSVDYTDTNQQDYKTTPDISFGLYYDTADNSQINHIDDETSNGDQFEYDFTQTALGMTGRVRDGQGRYSISRDPDGTPIMQRNPDGSTHYFELDRQGSIMGSTRGDNGTRTAAFHYKPYGDFDYTNGADSSNADNFLGFQGGFYHSSPRNGAFGYRWYSATIGQFTQPDPIGTPGSNGSGQGSRSGIGGPYSSDSNAYNFASNSPCNNSDPSGLDPLLNKGQCGVLADGGAIFTGLTATLTVAAGVAAVIPGGQPVAGVIAPFAAAAGTVGLTLGTIGLIGGCVTVS